MRQAPTSCCKMEASLKRMTQVSTKMPLGLKVARKYTAVLSYHHVSRVHLGIQRLRLLTEWILMSSLFGGFVGILDTGCAKCDQYEHAPYAMH